MTPPDTREDSVIKASLTPEDRARIRLEEMYRAEVRDTMKLVVRPRSRAWTFFNSNLGLWLLSAIFISGLGTLFTMWQHTRDLQHAKEEKAAEAQRVLHDRQTQEIAARRIAVDRLDREISYRLSRTLQILSLVYTRNEMARTGGGGGSPFNSREARTKLVNECLSWLTTAPQADSPPLYADYATYTLGALITELRKNIDDPAELKRIDESLARLSEFTLQLAHDGADPESAAGYADVIFHGLLIPRWKDSGFPLMKCENIPRCNP